MKEKVKIGLLIFLASVAATLWVKQATRTIRISGCTSGLMGMLEETYGPAPSEEIRKLVEDRMHELCSQLSSKGKL